MRKLMARACFSVDRAEFGIAALRARGFAVVTRVHEVLDMVEEGDPASLTGADIDALFAKFDS